jgi:transcriptional regulator with XRE-family HTH domain
VSKLIDQIRESIRTSGRSRYALAKATGLDQSHLSRLMAGTTGLSVEALERLAGALGFEVVITKRENEE